MNALPSLFVSHGAPTFAIEPGLAGPQLRALGQALGTPRAIIVVSPHWMTRQVEITATYQPATIHDFGGFPQALYALRYPAPGAPVLAADIQRHLLSEGIPAGLDAGRGLDHGAWVPLMYLYPDADVPVVQVSLPFHANAAAAFALGRALAPFSGKDVLIVGSGSLTHNLYEFRHGGAQAESYVVEFTEWVRQAVIDGDQDRLLHALEQAPHAQRAHPTPEHFLPLLVALGAASTSGPSTVLNGGIEHGVLAMESYVFGAQISLSVDRVS